MLKRNSILLMLVIAIVSLVYVACTHTQVPIKGSKNAITIPNNEIVWDLNGQWDSFVEMYGEWKEYGNYSAVFKIAQKGNSFVATKISGTWWAEPGSVGIRGEIHKDGFKKVQIMSAFGPLDAKAEISNNGNKIVIDSSNRTRHTLTRR